jgi:hypothetical protein
MTITDFKAELKDWRLTKYKLINFAIGISALLIYEFIGRPVYRPYIYANEINDFHVADTLGNSLGTGAAIFVLVAILSNEALKGNYLLKLVTISIILYEIAQPLLGKPIDLWDIAATLITGVISYWIFNRMFHSPNRKNTTTN